MNILDRFFPFLVGNRSQLLLLVYGALRLLSIFLPGAISVEQVDQVGDVLRPLAGATLAAKFSRNGT